MHLESSDSMPPLPLWERSDRIGDAIRVRGYGLSIDRDPSRQPSPTRGEGAHRSCRDIEPFQSKWIQPLAMRRLWIIGLVLAAAIFPARAQDRLNVVASFSILGDFVKNVGGDRVSVTTLVGPNGDAHVYTPTPQDAKKISDAKLVVVNGFGFEGWLPRLVKSSGGKAVIVTATNGIVQRELDAHADPHAWQS